MFYYVLETTLYDICSVLEMTFSFTTLDNSTLHYIALHYIKVGL